MARAMGNGELLVQRIADFRVQASGPIGWAVFSLPRQCSRTRMMPFTKGVVQIKIGQPSWSCIGEERDVPGAFCPGVHATIRTDDISALRLWASYAACNPI